MSDNSEKPDKPKNPVGRPSGYNPKLHPIIVQLLAEKGRTDDQIAQALDINRDTLYQWYSKYPELADAKKKAAMGPDDLVEISLFHRAVGYSHPEEKIFFRPGDKEPTRVMTIKHYPPDTLAGIYWTKNRDRARWRDSWQEPVNPGDSRPIKVEFSEVPPELIDQTKQDNLELPD